MIIPKHLWSVDSSNEQFLSIFTSKTISALHKVFLKDLCLSCAVSSLANTQIHLVLRKKRDSGHSSCINLQQGVQHLTSLSLNGKKAIVKQHFLAKKTVPSRSIYPQVKFIVYNRITMM